MWSAAVQISWNKQSFHMKKVQSNRNFLVHYHGHCFIVLYTKMAAMTSCENDV